MSLPRIVSRGEWTKARMELLAKEKELTRQRDALSVERRNLPMVEIDTPYEFGIRLLRRRKGALLSGRCTS